jgi:GNAT superfamily N-acetyltransferase
MYREIFINDENGNLEAYIINTNQVNLENWLKNKDYISSLDKIKEYNTVCILKNINVNEENRGERIGTYLLESLYNEAQEANIIILEADTAENNNFNLVEWYQRKGFIIINGDSKKFPLMLKHLR